MYSDSKFFCNFVRASKSLSSDVFNSGKSKSKGEQGILSGPEAKEFYDTVLSSTSNGCNDDRNSNGVMHAQTQRRLDSKCCGRITQRGHFSIDSATKSSSGRNRKAHKLSTIKTRTDDNDVDKEVEKGLKTRLENKFLQCAQNGDLNEVKKIVNDNSVDSNVSDQFGWTAVMCAAYSGHKDIVRYLLSIGALWKDIVNSKGQTALDLAQLAKQNDICKLLENWDSISRARKRKHTNNISHNPFWCTVCQQEFTEDEKKHQSSTVHQFNCQHKPKGTHYSIPDNNPGYKLMVKSGWDEEKGLGPEGEGRKYPIKTVLKRDRYGLGNSESSKPRVTHFGPHDDSAVKRQKPTNNERKESQRTLSKKQKRMKESKEKAWERNMRLYMNS